jgi:hypothetical protein
MCVKHLEKGVLHGLVGVVRVAQVVIRNPYCAALLVSDQLAEKLPSLVPLAVYDERLDPGCQPGVRGQRRTCP